MKAITTKYHGPTNTRGARYSATDNDGHKVTVSIDYALSSEGNHNAVALAFCKKMNWQGELAVGSLANEHVYVFIESWNRLSTEERPGMAALRDQIRHAVNPVTKSYLSACLRAIENE